MSDFSNEDIIIFIQTYNNRNIDDPLLNSKIPVYVEFLKTKKYYRDNGVQEDYFFNKRFGVKQDDIETILKLLDRIKRGKNLSRTIRNNVEGNTGINNMLGYGNFNENDNYEGQSNRFELLDEVQSAMDSYNNKMKKHNENKKWKVNEMNRYNKFYHPDGSVQYEPDRYYTEGLNSERAQIDFDNQEFARSPLLSGNKTNIIQKLDKINNILEDNQLITNDVDSEYKRSVPRLSSNKKVNYENKIDDSNMENQNLSINETRFWQDQSIMNARGITRNNGLPNKNPFEHQFQYLDCNYNRVIDPRLLGSSSRLDNRSTFKR